MPKLAIPGTAVEQLADRRAWNLPMAEGLVVTRRACVEFTTLRQAVPTAPLVVESADDDVFILHLGDGLEIVCRHDQFRQDFPMFERDVSGGAYRLDPHLGCAGEGRALGGSFLLKGLEILALASPQPMALALAARVERQLERPAGLYRLAFTPSFALSEQAATPDTGRPALLFIHGTGSSSRGSFKPLAGFELAALYGDNIFAFEHRTLTEDPIENALQLAQALPRGAEVHLVTHSRGGLVGDLLTLNRCAGCSGTDKGPERSPVAHHPLRAGSVPGARHHACLRPGRPLVLDAVELVRRDAGILH